MDGLPGSERLGPRLRTGDPSRVREARDANSAGCGRDPRALAPSGCSALCERLGALSEPPSAGLWRSSAACNGQLRFHHSGEAAGTRAWQLCLRADSGCS